MSTEPSPYRYTLTREWNSLFPQDKGRVCWVMLNPSTANETEDDPTIRRIVDFSKRWGYSSLVVVNLFAWRATDPKELLVEGRDVRGPRNMAHIEHAMRTSKLVVCAWGAFAEEVTKFHGAIAAPIVAMAAHYGVPVKALGATKNNMPRHPLYVPSRAKLVEVTGQ